MLNNQKVKVVEVYSDSALTAGTKMKAELSTVDANPNGRYNVVVGIMIEADYTADETGTGPTCTVEALVGVIASLSLKAGKLTRFNSYPGIDLYRRLIQMDNIVDPDSLGHIVPVADLAGGAGDTAVTLHMLVPLAHKWFQDPDDPGAFDGAILASELKKRGSLEVALNSSYALATTDASNKWAVSSSGVTGRITLLCVEVDSIPEMLAVEEYSDDTSQSTYVVPGPQGKQRRCTGLVVADDGTGALTLPTAFSVFADGLAIITGGVGDDYVELATILGNDGINDIAPAALPLITTKRRRNADQPLYSKDLTLHNVGAQHSGDYRVISRVAWSHDRREMVEILQRAEVPAAVIERYLAEKYAEANDTGVASVGNVPAEFVDFRSAELAGTSPIVIKAAQ